MFTSDSKKVIMAVPPELQLITIMCPDKLTYLNVISHESELCIIQTVFSTDFRSFLKSHVSAF